MVPYFEYHQEISYIAQFVFAENSAGKPGYQPYWEPLAWDEAFYQDKDKAKK